MKKQKVIGLAVLINLMLCTIAFSQNWQTIPFKLDRAVSAIYNSAQDDRLYIGGNFWEANGTSANIIYLEKDGTIGMLPRNNIDATKIMTTFQNKLYVGGFGGVSVWDGSDWHHIKDIIASVFGFELLDDNHLAVSGIGYIQYPDMESVGVWDGLSLSDFFSLDTLSKLGLGAISDIKLYKYHYYAGGNIGYYDYGKYIQELAVLKDGEWQAIGGGFKANGLAGINKMLIWKDELYVAGQFRERDGAPGNCIAKWDGNRWHRLGDALFSPFESSIYDMVVHDDKLYVTGAFYSAGNINTEATIARWDGSSWCTLKDSFNNIIISVASFNDELYVGGGFTAINGDTSYNYLAKWVGKEDAWQCSAPYVDTVGQVYKYALYPNPVRNKFYLQLQDPKQVYVYDALGRLVIDLIDIKQITNGIEAGHLASGMYIVNVLYGEGEIFRSKMVKL